MAERGALLPWAFGAFHAAMLLLVVVLAFQRGAGVGGLLAGVGTLAGTLLFAVLWAGSWWAAKQVLRGAELFPGPPPPLLGRAGLYGGVVGAVFLLAASLVLFVPRGEVGALLAAVFGSLVAFAAGAIAGLLLGALDAGLYLAARRLLGLPDARARPESGGTPGP